MHISTSVSTYVYLLNNKSAVNALFFILSSYRDKEIRTQPVPYMAGKMRDKQPYIRVAGDSLNPTATCVLKIKHQIKLFLYSKY